MKKHHLTDNELFAFERAINSEYNKHFSKCNRRKADHKNSFRVLWKVIALNQH